MNDQIREDLNLYQPIAYLANNKLGNKPFGKIADFRFYPYKYPLKARNLKTEKIVKEKFDKSGNEDVEAWREDLEVNDMAPYINQQSHLIKKLVENVERSAEIPATLTEVTRALTN